MYRRVLTKPDGRQQILYARGPIEGELVATSPSDERATPTGHLRWHPLRREWVVYATHRQHRTFLPPPEYNPLAPSTRADAPTEMPVGRYDIAVFDNLFPSFGTRFAAPPDLPVKTAPAGGAAEVVVFTQDATTSLGALPLWHIELLIEVWAERYRELGARDDIHYVMPFENRGVEVGVTLHHPHGQIYAYPFVPPIAARELEAQSEHFKAYGRGLLQDLLEAEIEDGRRLLYAGEHAVAFVPACARYAFEVWICPRRARPSLATLEPAEQRDLARALKTVLLQFDGLWSKPFPYVMAWHQAPTTGDAYPEAHVHAELYPAYRMPGRLKYLAGSELGAGVFTSDTLPEERAAELRAVEVSLE